MKPVELDLAQHPLAAERGKQIKINVQTPPAEPRRAAVGFGDRQPLDGQG